MKITFLGTGAADWNINDYSPDRFHRRYSSALIDNDLLIDPGPHIFHYCEHSGAPDLLDGVRNIIVTHSHRDHFTPENVVKLCAGRDCTLWGDGACLRKLIRELGEEETAKIRFVEFKMGQDYDIDGYKITPLRGNHATEDPEENTLIYLVEKDGRILFYGCDSAWIPTTAWNIIKNRPVNAMILELTCGEKARNDWRIFEHNTIEMLELMLITFRKYNCFADDVRYYVSHMALTLHTDHETLVETLKPLDVTPAYDGFSFDV